MCEMLFFFSQCKKCPTIMWGPKDELQNLTLESLYGNWSKSKQLWAAVSQGRKETGTEIKKHNEKKYLGSALRTQWEKLDRNSKNGTLDRNVEFKRNHMKDILRASVNPPHLLTCHCTLHRLSCHLELWITISHYFNNILCK